MNMNADISVPAVNAIAALPGAPFAALREQFAEYRSGGSCSLIGGGKTAPDQGADDIDGDLAGRCQ